MTPSKTPIYSDRRALEVILRWCDRGGEEPEGQCLYEIERIAKDRLVAPTMDEFHILSQEIRRQVEANHELRKAMLQAEQTLRRGLTDKQAWSVSMQEAIAILETANKE